MRGLVSNSYIVYIVARRNYASTVSNSDSVLICKAESVDEQRGRKMCIDSTERPELGLDERKLFDDEPYGDTASEFQDK